MKLHTWLIKNSVKQKQLASAIKVSPAAISRMIAGGEKPGMRMAIHIELATRGDVKASELISGVALGYGDINCPEARPSGLSFVFSNENPPIEKLRRLKGLSII